MTIMEFHDKYRDDMIYMTLDVQNKKNSPVRIHSDLLDIYGNYTANGTKLWLAVDDNDRVNGCLGYNILTSSSVKLHRFYAKDEQTKSLLLEKAEAFLTQAGYSEVQVHLEESDRSFFEEKEYVPFQTGWMRKVLSKPYASF